MIDAPQEDVNRVIDKLYVPLNGLLTVLPGVIPTKCQYLALCGVPFVVSFIVNISHLISARIYRGDAVL